MDLLNLSLIGWLFSIVSCVALVLGGWLIAVIHLRDESARKELAARVLDDTVLFGVWILGLAGGVGVLLDKSWSRPVLELFCWVLMVLVALSAYGRWRAAPRPRGMLAVSLALFVLPIAVVCVATIVTLRGETALRVLSG
jgi:uncharacterized membrane protein